MAITLFEMKSGLSAEFHLKLTDGCYWNYSPDGTMTHYFSWFLWDSRIVSLSSRTLCCCRAAGVLSVSSRWRPSLLIWIMSWDYFAKNYYSKNLATPITVIISWGFGEGLHGTHRIGSVSYLNCLINFTVSITVPTMISLTGIPKKYSVKILHAITDRVFKRIPK